jgi:hypothetical protein
MVAYSPGSLGVAVVAAIFGDLVDEEEGEDFEALIVETLLLFEMGADGLADLDAAEVAFADVARGFTGGEDDAVGEFDGVVASVDVGDDVTLVLLQLAGLDVEIIAPAELTESCV